MSIWEMSGGTGSNEVFRHGNLLLRCIRVGLLCTNCYLVINEDTQEAVIIDPGAEHIKIVAAVEEMGAVPVAILLTHGHFDHIMAVNELKLKYNIEVYVLKDEVRLLADPELNASATGARKGYSVTAEHLLEDDELIELAGIGFRVIATPGHTEGGACYYLEKSGLLFSGDTLFYGSIGRSDLPTGDSDLLIQSVRERLTVLPDDTFVLPGHGATTSIGREKEVNPFMRSTHYDE